MIFATYYTASLCLMVVMICLQVTLHNAVTNTTEHLDLYHTVNSSIFHDLTPNTAYSVAITAINQAGSGPTVYLNATTLGADKAGKYV